MQKRKLMRKLTNREWGILCEVAHKLSFSGVTTREENEVLALVRDIVCSSGWVEGTEPKSAPKVARMSPVIRSLAHQLFMSRITGNVDGTTGSLQDVWLECVELARMIR